MKEEEEEQEEEELGKEKEKKKRKGVKFGSRQWKKLQHGAGAEVEEITKTCPKEL